MAENTFLPLCLLITVVNVFCQDEPVSIDIIFVVETGQEELIPWFEESIASNTEKVQLNGRVITVTHDASDRDTSKYTRDLYSHTKKVCNSFSGNVSVVMDVTWTGNERVKTVCDEIHAPYFRIDLSISPYLDLLDKYLNIKNCSDVVIIFDSPKHVDEALYHWVDSTRLRMVVTYKLDEISSDRIKTMRPMPNAFALIGSTSNLGDTLQVAQKEGLVRFPKRWNLIFLDFNQKSFPNSYNVTDISLLKILPKTCCKLLELSECVCPEDFNMHQTFLNLIIKELADALFEISQESYDFSSRLSCSGNKLSNALTREIRKRLVYSGKINDNFIEANNAFRIKVEASVECDGSTIAHFNSAQQLVVEKNTEIQQVKQFFRVGVVSTIPWAYQETDPITGDLIWTGYCIDFLKKLADVLNFDYELVVPTYGTFGHKDVNGSWNGLIGDIVSGETYMAVAPLIMTADREEVVDFVPPYFEQGGISIVMRKPVHKTSLFKFMTVLKLEVWLSIVAALVVTACMIWFLDKYSPYSAQNNPNAYPYICRNFTLKESFWFALTSFTPQGGGEAPKSLSARTLVAAYWLFVVLMLATFTANLAAFLTVERMQTPVESLDQLSRQSRINYTVVESSLTHEYFINMKFAEDTLYRMWKELTLNASTEDKRYRVWDYPIQERYGHILLSINQSAPVANASEGFRIANERLEADFAFIHDSSEIKYEISKNCNFTEVGEVFAEKPYAIAIQQGSYLQDPISLTILDLQRDRFFEELQGKYWNNSIRGDCADDYESEGITLESLGGVFIATLVGLALAMVTLAGEVLYYKRKHQVTEIHKQPEVPNKKKKKHIKNSINRSKTVTIGSSFKTHQEKQLTPKISHISVYPPQNKSME